MVCIAGKYQSVAGKGNCSWCSAGTYQSGNGSTVCSACLPGKYQTGTGVSSDSSCALCQQGTYQDGTDPGICAACGAGKYGTATGSISCSLCDSGKYSTALGLNESLCLNCSAGTSNFGQGASACVNCALGKYSLEAQLTCTLCDIGKYASNLGSSNCSLCPFGTYTTGSGAGLCQSCPAGRYCTVQGAISDSFCTYCLMGTYSSTIGATSSMLCIGCVAGKFSSLMGAVTETNCSMCLMGTYSSITAASSSAQCSLCQAGTYSTKGGASVCSQCLAGTFSSALGNDLACDNCISGTYTSSQGASSSSLCLPCPAGTFSGSEGTTQCSTCQAGTFSLVTRATSAATCLPCEAGTYAFRDTAPSQGLLAFYAFSSSAFQQDSGTNGYLLQLSSPPPVSGADCLFGSCAELSFSSLGGEYFLLPALPIAGMPGFSICLWYKPSLNVSSGQTLFGFNSGQLNVGRLYESEDLIVRIFSGNHLVYYFTVVGGFRAVEWNHLCVGLDEFGDVSVFFNGTLQNEPHNVGSYLTARNWTSNYIGRTASESSLDATAYVGLVAEFRVYSRQLGQEEITELVSWRGQSYNASSCSSCVAGLFSTALSATSPSTCVLCERGSYASADGLTECVSCAAGTFLSLAGSTSSDECAQCSAGKYTAFQGSANCSDCPAGTSSTTSGAYSNSSCLACAQGKTSAAGADICRACTSSDTNAACASSATSETVIVVAVACGVAAFLLCLGMAVARWMYERKIRAKVSRRLIDPTTVGDDVVQEDMPWELRTKYTALKVLGRGAFGIVLQVQPKRNVKALEARGADENLATESPEGSMNLDKSMEHFTATHHPQTYAAKLCFPVGPTFTDEEKKGLEREVFLKSFSLQFLFLDYSIVLKVTSVCSL